MGSNDLCTAWGEQESVAPFARSEAVRNDNLYGKGGIKVPTYAWYYRDHSSDTFYWCYSNEMSATEFASCVSSLIGKQISASDTSYAGNSQDLHRQEGYASSSVHVGED